MTHSAFFDAVEEFQKRAFRFLGLYNKLEIQFNNGSTITLYEQALGQRVEVIQTYPDRNDGLGQARFFSCKANLRNIAPEDEPRKVRYIDISSVVSVTISTGNDR